MHVYKLGFAETDLTGQIFEKKITTLNELTSAFCKVNQYPTMNKCII